MNQTGRPLDKEPNRIEAVSLHATRSFNAIRTSNGETREEKCVYKYYMKSMPRAYVSLTLQLNPKSRDLGDKNPFDC